MAEKDNSSKLNENTEKRTGTSATRAKNKYKTSHYDWISFGVPVGMRAVLKQIAAKDQISVNELIIRSLNEKIKKRTGMDFIKKDEDGKFVVPEMEAVPDSGTGENEAPEEKLSLDVGDISQTLSSDLSEQAIQISLDGASEDQKRLAYYARLVDRYGKME